MDRDVLYLDEFRFPVLKDKATLHALISNATDFRRYWMINIPCEGADVVIDGETHHCWQPKVCHKSMTFSCRIPSSALVSSLGPSRNAVHSEPADEW